MSTIADIAARDAVTQARQTRRRFPPLDPHTLSLVLLGVLAVFIFATFADYGVSWDERVQNTYGLHLLSYYLSAFQDQSAFHYINLRYYGGAFDLIAAVINTVSPFGEYETRHLLGGIIGFVGTVGAWRLTRLLAGERAGLIVVALMALTPLIYGHSFINPKDAPFACAVMWSIYYSCRAIVEAPHPTRATAIGFGIALGFALGTRVVAVIALVYCAPAFVAWTIGRYRESRSLRVVLAEQRSFFGALLPALPIIALITAVFWPWVVRAPGNLETALKLFSHFPWQGQVLFDGTLYKADELPAVYLPQLLALQLPEAALLGLLGAAVFVVRGALARGLGVLTDPKSLCYSVVIAAALVPLVHFIVDRPIVYNGIRHYLFMVPPTIVLAGIGLDRMYAYLREHSVWVSRGFAAALGIAAALQLAIMAELHPYEYIYYNAFAGGVAGAAGRYDLDYWGLSLAEATRDLEHVIAQQRARETAAANATPVAVYVCGDKESAAYFFKPGSHLHYTTEPALADYAVGIRGAECTWEIKGPVLLEVKRAGAFLSYASDLRDRRG
ncbi:MAG TPA: glycosyltransferase family 39 protein [Pseudomonadales bacterium]|nr:glycosyltransferase family 39 protein [Pseudomonadales bacterium]